MSINLRPRTSKNVTQRTVPHEIVRYRNQRYEGFPRADLCWTQSKQHRKYFIDYLRCERLGEHHHDARSCGQFDTFVKILAGEQWLKFFDYYEMVGLLPRSKIYLDDLCHGTMLRALEKITFRKKHANALTTIPDQFESWPATFDAHDQCSDNATRIQILGAVERCIMRRIRFQDLCIKNCSTKISSHTHEEFVLKLQIIRAQLKAYM